VFLYPEHSVITNILLTLKHLNTRTQKTTKNKMSPKEKKLKVLFLSQRFLFPMDTGGKIRTGKILEQLKNMVSLTIISNVESAKDDDYLIRMQELCDRFIPVPWKEMPRYTLKFYMKIAAQSFSRYPISVLNDYSPKLERTVFGELKSNQYDLAICDFLQSTLNFRRVNGMPMLLFQHNVEATIAKRHLEQAKDPISKIFWGLQYSKMFRHEGTMCRQFDGIIAVSEKDRERMEEWYDAENVYEIPTGVDTDFYKPAENVREKKQLVFTGSMDWLPNEDAMIYFIEKIFPLIKKEEPDTTLVIVGRLPTSSLLKLTEARDDIVTTGWVDDTRPFMAESAVFIVPIRIGGGTRMKIYEALAMGKAVVSTSVGAEGLPLIHGEQIMFANEEKAFADHVVTLLRNENRREKLGASARKYVYENFRWEKVAEVFTAICEKVVGR
jgi:glycosyltransferase involved in cell wall biosynthesis